tara:strand:- start:293 stop:565 length:273 start_codon:yes stop_codon:yes gene_type:complete
MSDTHMTDVIVYSERLLDRKSIGKVRKLADELTGPEILYLINLQMAYDQNGFIMFSGICKKDQVQISGEVSHVTMNGNAVQFNMKGPDYD